ncbi:hypothetical protein PWT90_08077 [Aphanocladium album]|nr:hypothetical protein PWT90_08077 [Aphanocladium album]
MTEQQQSTPDTGPAPAAVPTNPFTAEFKEHVKTILEDWKCPGMSISVIDGGEIFSESFGHAVLPDISATNETLWYNGSCTKAYTGAMLANMIDRKSTYPALENGWATTMSSVIRDDFVLQDAWATQHVTTEDASCHNTGMGRHDMAVLKEVTLPDGTKRPSTQRDHVCQMRHLTMSDEPRKRFIYSNHVFMAISHLIETVAGKPLGDVLREHIWHPLYMNSTYLGNEEVAAGSATLATAYTWDVERKAYQKLPAETVTEFRGTDAVISTVSDAAKWLRCLLTEGEPLSAAMHADIRKPRIIMSPTVANGSDIITYGLGWQRTVYQGEIMYSHGGATMTQGCEMFWLPNLKFGFVAAGNAHRVSNFSARALAYKLIDEKIGVPTEKRKDFSIFLKMQEESYKAVKDTAMQTLFPNRGDTPMPCPIKTSDLAGTYQDKGYGKLVFKEIPHQEAVSAKNGETILEAERRDAFVPMRFRLVPATGLHWLVYMKAVDEGEDSLSLSMRSEFKVGFDGKVEALEVDFSNAMLGLEDGKVLFTKVTE